MTAYDQGGQGTGQQRAEVEDSYSFERSHRIPFRLDAGQAEARPTQDVPGARCLFGAQLGDAGAARRCVGRITQRFVERLADVEVMRQACALE